MMKIKPEFDELPAILAASECDIMSDLSRVSSNFKYIGCSCVNHHVPNRGLGKVVSYRLPPCLFYKSKCTI